MTQGYLAWPPACGGAGTLDTSPCSVRLPCEGAASTPPLPSGAQLLPLTPPRSRMSSPHHCQHPVEEAFVHVPVHSHKNDLAQNDSGKAQEKEVKTGHHLLRSASHAVELALHTLALGLCVGQTGTELVSLHAGTVELSHRVVAGGRRVAEL